MLEALVAWRREKALETKMPAYCIMHTKSLEAIADTMPKSPDELVGLSSIGPKRAEKYGNEIISIVDSFRATHTGGNAEDGE